MRIEETFSRAERKLTTAGIVERAKNEYFYYRDHWIYIPTGKLKLTLVSANQYDPHAALK